MIVLLAVCCRLTNRFGLLLTQVMLLLGKISVDEVCIRPDYCSCLLVLSSYNRRGPLSFIIVRLVLMLTITVCGGPDEPKSIPTCWGLVGLLVLKRILEMLVLIERI